MLPGETSWSFLAEMKTNEETRDIPVVRHTSQPLDPRERRLAGRERSLPPQRTLRELPQAHGGCPGEL